VSRAAAARARGPCGPPATTTTTSVAAAAPGSNGSGNTRLPLTHSHATPALDLGHATAAQVMASPPTGTAATPNCVKPEQHLPADVVQTASAADGVSRHPAASSAFASCTAAARVAAGAGVTGHSGSNHHHHHYQHNHNHHLTLRGSMGSACGGAAAVQSCASMPDPGVFTAPEHVSAAGGAIAGATHRLLSELQGALNGLAAASGGGASAGGGVWDASRAAAAGVGDNVMHGHIQQPSYGPSQVRGAGNEARKARGGA
jgi:hypothetical protein